MLCKLSQYIAVALFTLILASCSGKDEVKRSSLSLSEPIQFSYAEVDTTFGNCDTAMCHQVHLNYPVIESAAFFDLQELILNDIVYWQPVENPTTPSIASLLGREKELFDSVNSDDGFSEIQNWYLTIDVHVDFNTSGIFSYTINKDAFYSGAHPMYEARLIAVFVEQDSLKPITWTDVILVDSLSKFVQTAKTSFINFHNLDPFMGINDQGFWFEKGDFELNDNFSIHEDGISLMYNPYEIASYATGTTTLFIKWDEMKPWLNPSFSKRIFAQEKSDS